MNTRQNILALLENRRGAPLSGQKMADALGISRAAVWKSIEALRGQGLPIEAVKGGYRVAPGSDVLSPQAVQAHLPEGFLVQVHPETPSTNLLAKQWALAGAPHGSMVLANAQTAGRGRLGRSFHSPEGGLYLSIILRPQIPVEDAVQVTAAAAVAVCEAVQQLCQIELGIKWVNDLFYNGKKCCGILTEAATDFEVGKIEYLVVGVGLNYTTPQAEFAPEVGEIATALFAKGDAPCTRGRLAAGIHTRLLALFAQLPQKTYLQPYRKRSLALGKQVMVQANQPYPALATQIDEHGRLVVQTQSGEVQALSSGEISIKI